MNPVDTLFVLICAAMVLLMTPALAVSTLDCAAGKAALTS